MDKDLAKIKRDAVDVSKKQVIVVDNGRRLIDSVTDLVVSVKRLYREVAPKKKEVLDEEGR